ncbi:MAG: MFS transporter [Gammaproteobacteria bacterium]|nr:MFS transporter [Gammaproteobacteria bacterium]NIV49641.1 MFS transporter [Gammaproteobacteria bacterium]NIW57039.1 MFS transporter [Gammaproteobacteria bacterium]
MTGAIGNALEWYDFAVFGFFAAAISKQFFPSDDPLAGLINTFGVFAAGYFMRPIGGILFGWMGDRLGRSRALRASMSVTRGSAPRTRTCTGKPKKIRIEAGM